MPQHFTDTGELRVVGDNPVMYLYSDSKSDPSTSINLWRVCFSPAGPGNALFWHSEVSGGVRILGDNAELCRWLQGEILRPSLPFKSADLPIGKASFTWNIAMPAHLSATIRSETDVIDLSWYDFDSGFAGHTAPELENGETHGHYAVYFRAKGFEVTRNGETIPGRPGILNRNERELTTTFVALAESWQRYLTG